MKTKSLKTLLACSFLGLSSLSGFAEGNGGGNGFIEAAERYAQQAIEAEAAGNVEDAAIYLKLSQIKQAAAAAAEKGEGFNWDEYHQLSGQLSGKKGHKHGKGKNTAAERYANLAKKARAEGNEADAKIYDRLSQIKLDAAAHKGENPFDWAEYHNLNGQLSGKNKHAKKDGKKHDKKHGKKDAGNGFLKTAQEYTVKANEAMQAGDEESAAIYTKLAAIKREAAAAAQNGQGYDWAEYFKLKGQLKK